MFSRKKISRIMAVVLLSLLLSSVVLAQDTHKGGKLVVSDSASNGSLDPFPGIVAQLADVCHLFHVVLPG